MAIEMVTEGQHTLVSRLPLPTAMTRPIFRVFYAFRGEKKRKAFERAGECIINQPCTAVEQRWSKAFQVSIMRAPRRTPLHIEPFEFLVKRVSCEGISIIDFSSHNAKLDVQVGPGKEGGGRHYL